MIKKALKIVSFTLLITMLLFTASCNRRKKLSELRREEREAIAKYIQDNDLNIIHEMPEDSVMTNPKDFYLSSSGLYINISKKGEGNPPKTGDLIIMRHYEFNLAGDTTSWGMEPSESTDAFEFRYNKGDTYAAFDEAVGYMHHLGEAELIVPSSIGTSTAQNNITPYRYQIKIKIQ